MTRSSSLDQRGAGATPPDPGAGAHAARVPSESGPAQPTSGRHRDGYKDPGNTAGEHGEDFTGVTISKLDE